MAHTVLFVDDDLAVLQALVRRLRKEPYQIRTATSAEEARGTFDRGPIDLVVCDWRMPGMSGTELLAIIAREFPECIRIMLTGEPSLPIAMGAVNHGEVYRFLTKPYDADALAAIIREALAERERNSGGQTAPESRTGSRVADSRTDADKLSSLEEAVLAHIEEAILSLDSSGRLVQCNEAARRFFDFGNQDLMNRPLAELLSNKRLREVLAEPVVPPSSEADTGHAPATRREFIVADKDGAEIPIELVTIRTRIGNRPALTSIIRVLPGRQESHPGQDSKDAGNNNSARPLRPEGRFENAIPEFEKLLALVTGSCDALLADGRISGTARDAVRTIRRANDKAKRLTARLAGGNGASNDAGPSRSGRPPRKNVDSASKPAAAPPSQIMERR